jgi:valyl-tRNA synthetase
MDFGTGALKVTPAHDMNDYQLGEKHGLEVIDIFTDDGYLNEAAQIFIGEERFAARKKIVTALEEKGILVKTEDYASEVGYSERNPDTVVEPRLSLQWWVSMKEISKPALDAVMNGEISFIPAKFKNLYRHWMENVKDWCISRQLWWGHRIPAWYDKEGRFVVAANEAEAKQLFREQYAIPDAPVSQDEGCLDTWFSSWLWPFEVFKGLSNPGNEEIKYYYPTTTLVTAPEIIFFWVARMIIAGEEYMKAIPFRQVYFTGIVRDKLGRKMSKQLGNSPDLLLLLDQYGADATRFGIMISSPAGNDLLFDEGSLEQGRNFVNKIWNALKLVKMWEARIDSNETTAADLSANSFALNWFENRLNEVKSEVDGLMKQFRLSEALKTIYSLVWDDFCSWYLEWVKPGFELPVARTVFSSTIHYFTELLQLMHPFMPFVTEEIYHLLQNREDDICELQLTAPGNPDIALLEQGRLLKEVITGLRDARNRNQLKPKEAIQLFIQAAETAPYQSIQPILSKQVNAKDIAYVNDGVDNSISIVIGKDRFYIKTEQPFDTGNQKAELEKEMAHLQGFLLSVEKKLGNERFVQNAKPEVLALEQKKKADATEKLKAVTESLAVLNK